MIRRDDEKAVLVEYLRELHLPTVRSSFEEAARRAEMEVLFTLLAERYPRLRSSERIVAIFEPISRVEWR